MPLIPLEQLLPDLVCPRCRRILNQNVDGFHCSAGDCPFVTPGSFATVDGCPVLIDFQESILDPAWVMASGGKSVINRAGKESLKQRVKSVLFPINPVSQTNAERFAEQLKSLAERPRLLVIGGGVEGVGMQALYEDPAIQVIGFDIYASELTQMIADGHQIPLRGACVDGVWIQGVLSVLLSPWRAVEEIHRVLKPGGCVYAETAFLQPVCEGRYDFFRFTESGHRWLFRHFELVNSGIVQGPGYQMLWTIDRLFRGLFRSVAAGNVVKALFFWLRYLDKFLPQTFSSDAAAGVFFLGKKSQHHLRPQQIAQFYRGAFDRDAAFPVSLPHQVTE